MANKQAFDTDKKLHNAVPCQAWLIASADGTGCRVVFWDSSRDRLMTEVRLSLSRRGWSEVTLTCDVWASMRGRWIRPGFVVVLQLTTMKDALMS